MRVGDVAQRCGGGGGGLQRFARTCIDMSSTTVIIILSFHSVRLCNSSCMPSKWLRWQRVSQTAVASVSLAQQLTKLTLAISRQSK
jgi:hypothetical protein